MGLVGGFDLAGEAVLEATACAVQAEAKGAEGATQSSTWLPLLGLWLGLGAGNRRSLLLANVKRLQITADISDLDVQEVTAGAKGTNAKGAEGATGDIPAPAQGGSLLSGVVYEQAAAAVVAVASRVVAAAQLRLVLWVAEGNMELMQAVGKLAALGVLAETSSRVAGAKLRLVAGGADPGDEGRGGGLYQGKQGLSQRESNTTSVSIGLLTGQQVVHQLLILAGRQEQVVTTGLKNKVQFSTAQPGLAPCFCNVMSSRGFIPVFQGSRTKFWEFSVNTLELNVISTV